MARTKRQPAPSKRLPDGWDVKLDGPVPEHDDYRIKMTAAQRRACRMMVDGHSSDAIAQACDVSTNTLRQWLASPFLLQYLGELVDAEHQMFLTHRSNLQQQSMAVFREILSADGCPELALAEDWARVAKVRADVAKSVLGWAVEREKMQAQGHAMGAAAGAFVAGAAAATGIVPLPPGGLSEVIRGQLQTVGDPSRQRLHTPDTMSHKAAAEAMRKATPEHEPGDD